MAGFIQAYWKCMPIARSFPVRWERVPVEEFNNGSLIPVFTESGRQEYSPNYLNLTLESSSLESPSQRVIISLSRTASGIHREVKAEKDKLCSRSEFGNMYVLLQYLHDQLVFPLRES